MELSAVPQPQAASIEPTARTAEAPAARTGAARETNVKETINSILVAFILALIFRTFVVEAFVIPTGSMAPTLHGAHMRFRCDDCGYGFDVNFSAANPDDPVIPDRYNGPLTVFCPNCGYQLANGNDIPSSDPNFEARRQLDQAYKPPVSFGDRILVLKYLYLLQKPQPWDVVVFKSPVTPWKHDYQQNYIKRMIGRPGESVLILDGDIYIGARDASPTEMHIASKPPRAQDSLWQPIYDNDYLPRGLARANHAWRQPWQLVAGSGWDVDSNEGRSRSFAFANDRSIGRLAFDPNANPNMHAFTDWYAYDTNGSTWSGRTPVSDLKVAMMYDRSAGAGPLRIAMSKLDRTFIAELTPTTARLLSTSRPPEARASQDTAGGTGAEIAIVQVDLPELGAGKGPVEIEFQNVDYRVSLKVNGREVLATTPEEYAPDIATLFSTYHDPARPPMPAVSIEAQRQHCEVSHVRLWRDVYYINSGSRPDRDPRRDLRDRQDENGAFWASPDNIMRLGDDEYFVLGDNSPASFDARCWSDDEAIHLPGESLDVESGRVPARFLLGKAFFVYWPAGFRPSENSPAAFVPDFADMRMIR